MDVLREPFPEADCTIAGTWGAVKRNAPRNDHGERSGQSERYVRAVCPASTDAKCDETSTATPGG